MAQGETYKEFVEKFKPKKTTDDCYTPDPVYNAIKDYVVSKFNVNESQISRPFWPGGNYQKENYDGKVVVDNPPFSIITKIVTYYVNRDIKFFLFAPALTLFQTSKSSFGKFTMMPLNETITYQNGAKVSTSFVTNLFNDGTILFVDPKLKNSIYEANKLVTNHDKPIRPKYDYPSNVIRTTDLAKIGRVLTEPFSISVKNAKLVRELDCQQSYHKQIYGGGYSS